MGDPDSGYVVFDEDGHPVPCPTPGADDVVTDEPTATPTDSSARYLPV
jgi:hypothetical protein